MTEREKMLAGELYRDSKDGELFQERLRIKELIYEINALRPEEDEKKDALFRKLLGKTGENFYIETPFRCEYGHHIEIGEGFFANFNCIMLDCAKITIGRDVLIGPNVSLLTAGHPVDPEIRRSGLEFAKPIVIGDNVWLGGGCIVTPGVTIGSNSVIGAGSVVTKDIPEGVVAVGVPCRVIGPVSQKKD